MGENTMQVFNVIMAGGGGTRFWPLSRQRHPKQLLNLSGRDIMVNETILRMESIVPREHTFIVTNEAQADLLEELVVPGVAKEHILREPAARNTAPCILYAALKLSALYGEDGVMCVLASDHYVGRQKAYEAIMQKAVEVAGRTGKAVTVGITPAYPAESYGYIAMGDAPEDGVYRVEHFVEKPSRETAEKYLAAGNYLWNSGMFVWKISTVLEAYRRYLPDMLRAMGPLMQVINTEREQDVLAQVYPSLENISVDYGIMERMEDVLVVPGDYGWSDVGSLDGLEVFHAPDGQGNVLLGDVLARETKNSIIRSGGRLVAVNGVEGLMVIDTPDALLICPKDRAQDVKYIVEQLKEQGRKEI